jgi:hypothetical protein
MKQNIIAAGSVAGSANRSVAALDVISTYRALSDKSLIVTDKKEIPTLLASNLLSIPANVEIKEDISCGPHTRLLLYGDEKRLCAKKCQTDADPNVRVVVYAGMKAFEITTSSRGLEVKQTLKFESKKLLFASYHSILAVLQELVIVHELPLEWSACWILMNRAKLLIYDSYVSFSSKQLPIRPLTPANVLIALEGHNIGAFVSNTTPKLLDTMGKIVQGTGNSEPKDAVPIPYSFVRRSSSVEKNGDPIYYMCSGYDNCEKAIKICHFRAKEHMDMIKLDASSIVYLVEKLLDKSYILLPLPYLHVNEANRVADMLNPESYTYTDELAVFK